HNTGAAHTLEGRTPGNNLPSLHSERRHTMIDCNNAPITSRLSHSSEPIALPEFPHTIYSAIT
ncbi:hypothetical protein CRENBAI_009557, partial [Crenichthys baileyi]